jgi:hypothetical protein
MNYIWFEPVLPDECAETPKTSILERSAVMQWPVTKSIPTCVSSLEEVSYNKKLLSNLGFHCAQSQKRGIDAEHEFLILAKKRGWIQKFVAEADFYDYKHHVDAMLKLEKEEIWVDVKCMRSLRRGWSEQSEFMWVELHSTGWLFGGKATVIAQKVCDNTFLLFDRVSLGDYVKSVVDTKSPVVSYAEQSLNRVFIRETKNVSHTTKSFISLVNTQEAFKNAGCGVL